MNLKFSSKLFVIGFLLLQYSSPNQVNSHGSHGADERPPEGQYMSSKSLTFEGHGGFENNLKGDPKHYGFDAILNYLMQWGLKNNGVFGVEAGIGSASVWGEAEHFYGAVHAHEEHEEHEEEEEEHEEHGHGNADFKRIDFKGLIKANYSPNNKLDFYLSWKPYLVTKKQGEEIAGIKNELIAKTQLSFGDGDVNFALGDSLYQIVDGIYISAEHKQGWESDGKYMGNYTDTRLGVQFNYDLINFRIDGGPRFYDPGKYSGLKHRTDFAAELELGRPLGENKSLFLHWQPVYTADNSLSEGWGEGWSHHVGAGITFKF